VCTCAPTHSLKVCTTKCAPTFSFIVCRLQRGNLFYTLWHSHVPTIQACTCAPTHFYKLYTTKVCNHIFLCCVQAAARQPVFIPCGTHTFLQYKCARVHPHIPIKCTPQSVHSHFPMLCAGCSAATCFLYLVALTRSYNTSVHVCTFTFL
jgi:hypothetical protein